MAVEPRSARAVGIGGDGFWRARVGSASSRLLSPEQTARYQPWLDNDKRLHALTRELEALAIRAAEQAEGWGEK